MKSAARIAWNSYSNRLSDEGLWPLTNSTNIDVAIKLRHQAMKEAFFNGWIASKKHTARKNSKL